MMASVAELVGNVDQRPGFKVVNYRDIAIPIFKVQPLLTLQTKSEIGPIELFIFRLLSNKFLTSSEISNFLGLPERIVSKQLGAMVYEGTAFPGRDNKNEFHLTNKGKEQYREESRSAITKEVLPFYVDGLTREVTPISSQSLFRNKDLKEQGIVSIAPIPRHTPRADELDIAQMNNVLNLLGGDRKLDKKIIKVDALVDKNHLFYRPATAIAFKSGSGRTISIGFLIDGVLSNAHEKIFMSGDEARKSTVFGDIFDSGRRRQEIQKVAKELENDFNLPERDESEQSTGKRRRRILSLKDSTKSKTSIGQSHVKTLSVYEHPPLLEYAILNATDRLLIISPWIRANVVDGEFLMNLESCLKKNVNVTIAYGIGRRDTRASEQDIAAVESLTDLAGKYNNFQLRRKGNTHAKVLIKDSEFFITTSFNWLSFRGDPAQPFREEEGTYVVGENAVNEYYSKLIGRMTSIQ